MALKFGNGIDLDNKRLVNLGDPSAATDAANKQYVDAFVRGLSWKQSVRAASTGDVTVSSAPSTLDGVTLADGDRVLLKDQTDESENGIYVFTAAAAALTRATDADSAADLAGATLTVTEGSVNADRVYRLVTDSITLGTTSLSWTQLGGGGTAYTAGDGLAESPAGQFNVNAGTGLEVSSDTVRIASSAAGNGLTGGGGSALAVNTGDGLEINADAVRVDSTVVRTPSTVVRKYASDIGDGSTSNIVVTHNLGTKDVTVQVYEVASPFAQIFTDVEHTSTSQITVKFGTAPSTGQYRVVVHG